MSSRVSSKRSTRVEGSPNPCVAQMVTVVVLQMGRGQKAVDREVAEAIESFDTNGDGQLCFDEFLQLSMNSEHFKFKVAVLNHACHTS